MKFHDSLRLYISEDAFTIGPISNDPSIRTENIVIQRNTGNVSLNALGTASMEEEIVTIYGIVGFIRLLAGEYMVVITDRLKVGYIGGHDIFKIKDYRIIPFSLNNLSLSEAQADEEALYISLLHSHLRSGEFHFSYGYEITHSLQRQAELRGNTQPYWERADERFFWNYRLQSKLIDHAKKYSERNLDAFILPVINGFIEINDTEINGKPFTFALISRRCRHRAGTRYFSRGVDMNGNVSNFNETEQIIVVDSTTPRSHLILAHVQTRGSIPVFWAQINNIKYTPELRIFENTQTGSAFRRHFEKQKKYYGSQLVINLVNKKGYENKIGTAFSKEIDKLGDPNIRYYHFDFHQECSSMRWHRVSLILEHFHGDIISQGGFKAEVNRDGIQRVFQKQTSIFRTNCMDCLDRTNVVQSVISRWVLNRQLQEAGILTLSEKFESSEPFEVLFRNVWANNADIVSKAYSGTGALKTDFTRTGFRTKLGALQDLQNSIIRYVKNNFLDGTRQDAYDIFLTYDIQDTEVNPLLDSRPIFIKMMPIGLVIGFTLLVTGIMVPESLFSTHVVLFLSFCIAIIAYTINFIIVNGVYYVNWPRLVPLGYDLPLPWFPVFQSVASHEVAEIELGWKNE